MTSYVRDADECVEGMKGQLHQQFDQIRRQIQCREGFPLAERAIAETRTRFRGERHAVVGRDDVNPVHGWACHGDSVDRVKPGAFRVEP